MNEVFETINPTQAIALKEYGIKQLSFFAYNRKTKERRECLGDVQQGEVALFNLAEIEPMMQHHKYLCQNSSKQWYYYSIVKDNVYYHRNKAEAYGNLLIELIQDGLLRIKEINNTIK